MVRIYWTVIYTSWVFGTENAAFSREQHYSGSEAKAHPFRGVDEADNSETAHGQRLA
jgi:hypothetical protein